MHWSSKCVCACCDMRSVDVGETSLFMLSDKAPRKALA